MEKLREQLDELVSQLENANELREKLDELVSMYPFNEFEFIISHLLVAEKISLEGYYEIRQSYIDRNLYLNLFEISAPRSFGEIWAQGHLKELVPLLERPTKKLDADYVGQYDFFLPPDIKIEVKASRAVEFRSSQQLSLKALSFDSSKNFDMNFQQIKPRYCDVFVWFGVWRDVIKCWVIPSFEVENNPYYSKGQHRGNVGEGQLHFKRNNIREFEQYLIEPSKIEETIRKAFAKEKKLREQKCAE